MVVKGGREGEVACMDRWGNRKESRRLFGGFGRLDLAMYSPCYALIDIIFVPFLRGRR